MLVFQYGSNLSSMRLNSEQRLRGDARVVGVAHTLADYRFCFPVWGGINGCAAAGILPGGPGPVWGVVYEIPDWLVIADPELDRPTLDAIEDEGRDYDRGPIEVVFSDGTPVREAVQTYHPKKPSKELITQWHYVRHILAGAEEHALPKGYRRYLIDCILTNNPGLSAHLTATPTND